MSRCPFSDYFKKPTILHITRSLTPLSGSPTYLFILLYDIYMYIYRVIQEESALIWEMIVRVILSKKKVHMNMGPILNGYGVMGIF